MTHPEKYRAAWVVIALFLAIPAFVAGSALAWALAVLL